MKIGIINYNAGNLFSINKIIKDLGFNSYVIDHYNEIKNLDKIIMPGVGSFNKAMKNLEEKKFIIELKEQVLEKKKLFLGICLGMQLMFKESNEDGFCKGLNFFNEKIKNMRELGCNLNLPHIGWNNIEILKKHKMMKNISQKSDFYFANNFAVEKTNNHTISITNYGIKFISAVAKDNLWGVQFHPEKSSLSGKELLNNFLKT